MRDLISSTETAQELFTRYARQLEFEDFIDELAGKDAIAFEQRPLSQRLDALKSEFGIAPCSRKEFESIMALRRCLVHRLGVVGKKDARHENGSALHVEFHIITYTVKRHDGSYSQVDRGTKINAGESIEVNIAVPRELTYARGSIVSISHEDAVSMLFTQFKFASSIVQEVSKYCAGQGFPPSQSTAYA